MQQSTLRICREEYLKTIKIELLSTLASLPQGATLTVVIGTFKEDSGEEPIEVARNLGYASFDHLLQSEEFSDIVYWEITNGTGTGDSGLRFCYKAKPNERIQHIMREMEESEMSLEEHARAEELKKRAMLEHPQNDERTLEGKERILRILDRLGALKKATNFSELKEDYHIEYNVKLDNEELRKYFGRSSPKKVFLCVMHQELDLFEDKNHAGQLYLKMKRPIDEVLMEYAQMREEAKKTKPTVEKRKAFINPLKEYSHNLGVPSTDSGGPKKQSSVGEEHGTSASVKSPAEYVDANGNRHVYAGFGNGAYVKATTAKDFDSNPIEPAWITNPLSSSDDGDALGTTIVRPKPTASAYFRKPLPRLVPVSVVGTSSEDSDDESPGSTVSSYDSAKGPSADHGSLNATASSKTTHSEWSGSKMTYSDRGHRIYGHTDYSEISDIDSESHEDTTEGTEPTNHGQLK
ncbi:hypothetical protein AAVH_09854 [Aphelenchoides avenae]|nr:hypothetical protein AAVH_09854 [Aphelenchus avenae]